MLKLHRLGSLALVTFALAVTGCGGSSAPHYPNPTEDMSAVDGGVDQAAPDASSPDSAVADGGDQDGAVDAAVDAAHSDDLAPAFHLFVGNWRVINEDRSSAGFTNLDVNLDGTFSELGRTDGAAASGVYSEPDSIPVDPSFGSPAPGTSGPYLELDTAPAGDSEWIYGSAVEAADGSTLTMTLYAQRFGMGLRWATPTTIHLVASPTPPAPLLGTWKVAPAQVASAGFATLTILADGTFTQTGRTDDEPPAGNISEPATVPVGSDYGTPPAGLTGPYIDIDDSPAGDGEWVYGWSVSADGKTLTLTLWAQRFGMGLRWATPVTVTLTRG